MRVTKQSQKLHFDFYSLFIPFSLLTKIPPNFPSYLTHLECFHASTTHLEVNLHSPALPRGRQVPTRLTDSRLKTVSIDIRITQCFQEWKVHNFFPRNRNVQGSPACREDKKAPSERLWGKGAEKGRPIRREGGANHLLLAKAWALPSRSPEFGKWESASYQLRELCSFVYSTNILSAHKVLDSGYMIVTRANIVSALVEFTI